MGQRLLYGIQQIGIGVSDIYHAQKWYVELLEARIKILEDSQPATAMAPYMGGESREKTAMILLNEHGGGGMELWQHTSHLPSHNSPEFVLGSLGINYPTVCTSDLTKIHSQLSDRVSFITDPREDAFFIKDLFGNLIEIKSLPKHQINKTIISGVAGCTIGVSDIDRSLPFYGNLGFNNILDDQTTQAFDVLNSSDTFRTVTLTNPYQSKGRFGKFFGDSHLRLIQNLNQPVKKIYENRYWGDPGYIHLCFDVYNLKEWIRFFNNTDYPFTIDMSENFKMGDAKGNWGYIEDPDGTLIEMVETLTVPVIPQIGLNINLTKKSPHAPINSLLIQLLKLKRIKHSMSSRGLMKKL